MNKKVILILGILVVIILAIFLYNVNNKKSGQTVAESEVVYNSVENTYYLYDENDNLIHSSQDEADLKIYQDNPDYDAQI